IQDDQIEPALQGLFQPTPALVFTLHGEALALQKLTQKRAQFNVIVDDEQPHALNLARLICRIRDLLRLGRNGNHDPSSPTSASRPSTVDGPGHTDASAIYRLRGAVRPDRRHV